MKIEKRTALLGVEKRADDDGNRMLVGYAAVFNSDADIYGMWVERIVPGAFVPTLTADVRALVDHDSGRVIGRTKSGTLRLAEDAKGLRVEIDVPDTTDGNDLWTLVERGDVSGMSFGFRVTKQEWDETVDPPIRTIMEVELIEVSAVAFPAYDDTTIGKRALEEHRAARAAEANADESNADESATDEQITANEAETNPAATDLPGTRKVANDRLRRTMLLALKVRNRG